MKKNKLTQIIRSATFSVTLTFALVIGTAIIVLAGAKPTEAEAMAPQLTPTGDQNDIVARSHALAEKWYASISANGWIYLTYKEHFPYARGVDPDTGWPIFSQIQWEHWYLLDEKGQVTVYLLRTTDMVRGNVYRLVWRGGHVTRIPGFSPDSELNWKTFDYTPILDHFCVTMIEDTELLAGGSGAELSSSLLEGWQNNDGRDLWYASAINNYPSVTTEDVTGNSDTYISNELTCLWDPETGSIIKTIYSFTNKDGAEVIYQQTFDYAASNVKSPPEDMEELLSLTSDK